MHKNNVICQRSAQSLFSAKIPIKLHIWLWQVFLWFPPQTGSETQPYFWWPDAPHCSHSCECKYRNSVIHINVGTGWTDCSEKALWSSGSSTSFVQSVFITTLFSWDELLLFTLLATGYMSLKLCFEKMWVTFSFSFYQANSVEMA